MSPQIRCFLIDNHHGLIFHPDSIRILRQQHRIVGCFTGNLPEHPRQNNQLGLPFELSPEQCYFLSAEQIISIYQIIPPIEDNEQDHLQYLSQLDNEFEKQQLSNGHETIDEVLLNRLTILQKTHRTSEENPLQTDSFLSSLLQTNNAWQNCSKSLDEHEQQILLNLINHRLKQFTLEYMFIHLPIESKRTNLLLHSITSEQLKLNFSVIQQLRCDVFADLYSKQYWISNGLKFGGDFLVYFDDPSKCHSTLIITCVLRHEIASDLTILPLTHLIARCRVAVNVKKTCVLASRKSSTPAEIEYLTIQWNGF